MHVLALRAAAEVASVQLCEGISELNSLRAAIKYIKKAMCMYFYICFIQIYCVNVCVCLRNGLSSHKCWNYLHARLSSISICRDCSKSLRHKHTLIHTHTLMYTHTTTLTHTHTHSHTHTCPASPRLVFRLSILHMHLCWHYYNTRPTLPPIPPLFSVFPSSNLQLCIEVASFGWSLPRCMQRQRQRQRKRKLLFCSAIGKSENCKTKIVPLFILLSLSLSYISFRFSLLPAYKALANN